MRPSPFRHLLNSAGFGIREIARVLGGNSHTAVDWSTGKQLPTLGYFAAICEILKPKGITADQVLESLRKTNPALFTPERRRRERKAG